MAPPPPLRGPPPQWGGIPHPGASRHPSSQRGTFVTHPGVTVPFFMKEGVDVQRSGTDGVIVIIFTAPPLSVRIPHPGASRHPSSQRGTFSTQNSGGRGVHNHLAIDSVAFIYTRHQIPTLSSVITVQKHQIHQITMLSHRAR